MGRVLVVGNCRYLLGASVKGMGIAGRNFFFLSFSSNKPTKAAKNAVLLGRSRVGLLAK